MFGVASFAQTPFASLAGTSIAFSITEDFGAADFSAQQAAFLFSHVEVITENDIEITGNALFTATINEVLTPDDFSTQLSTFLQSISENFEPADASTIAAQFASSLTEDASLADAQEVYSEFLQTRTEGFTVDDASTQQSNFFQDQTENANLADTPAITAQFPLVRSEDSVIDDASTQQYDFLQSRAENASLADALAIAAQFAQSQSENANLADASTQQSVFLQSLTENANLADAPTILAQFAQSISEGMTLEDLEAITAQFVQSVTEGLAAADIVVIIQVFFESVVENFSAADANTAAQGFFFSVVENLNSADAATVLAAFQTAITENAVLADAFGVGGWIKIIDTQGTGWAVINNYQGTVAGSWSSCAASSSALVMLNLPALGQYLRVTGGQVTVQQLPYTGYYGVVTYVSGYFYAFTPNYDSVVPVLRSADGIAWEVVPLPFSGRPVLAVYGNGTQLGIVQRVSPTIGLKPFISTDNGASWTQGSGWPSAGQSYGQILWDGAKYVGCVGAYIAYSSDGLNWTSTVFNGVKERGYIVQDGTTYVALQCASFGPSFPSDVSISNDGITWATVTPTTASATASVLTLHNGRFLVLNEAGEVLQLDPVTQTFATVGQVPNSTFPRNALIGFTTATLNGVTYVPSLRSEAYDGTYLTTLNFALFYSKLVDEWANVSDSPSTSWQNTNNAQ